MQKELGGDSDRTTDPNWPKGCPKPCGIMLSNKSWGKKEEREDVQSNGVCLPTKPLGLMSPDVLEVADHLVV